ncbi:MAG TPA: hypothetical protein VIL68_10340 [Propionibacteriaceae bacterium]
MKIVVGALVLLAWIPLLVGGIVLNGLAGALYVGAHLGPGPRDGLWVAITRRYGLSIRLVRTVIELTVLAIGWLMGGTVGVGTVLYALSIGHLNQFFLHRVQVRVPVADEPVTARSPPLRPVIETIQSRHVPLPNAVAFW